MLPNWNVAGGAVVWGRNTNDDWPGAAGTDGANPEPKPATVEVTVGFRVGMVNAVVAAPNRGCVGWGGSGCLACSVPNGVKEAVAAPPLGVG